MFTQSFIQAEIKENIKAPRHVTEFPAQRASNAENGSIWWRHHDDVNKTSFAIAQFANSATNYACGLSFLFLGMML